MFNVSKLRNPNTLMLSLVAVAALAYPANGHKHPCAHNHILLGTECRTGAKCNNPELVDCQTNAVPRASTCICPTPTPPPSGGCMAIGTQHLNPDIGGAPNPGLTTGYQPVPHPGNQWDLMTFSQQVIAEFGPDGNDLNGGMIFQYGDFNNPQDVQVIVLDVNLVLQPYEFMGQNTGPNFIHLPDADSPVELTYDATTGIINTLDDGGIPVVIDNEIMIGLGATLYLDAAIDPETGEMDIFAQVEQFFPASTCPGDTDGSGDINFGDLLAVLGAWGPYPDCPPFIPEDPNEDCEVNFGDILVVLGNWGPCP